MQNVFELLFNSETTSYQALRSLFLCFPMVYFLHPPLNQIGLHLTLSFRPDSLEQDSYHYFFFEAEGRLEV